MKRLRSWFTRIVRGPSMLPARWWEFRDVGAAIQAACRWNTLGDLHRRPELVDHMIVEYIRKASQCLPKTP